MPKFIEDSENTNANIISKQLSVIMQQTHMSKGTNTNYEEKQLIQHACRIIIDLKWNDYH